MDHIGIDLGSRDSQVCVRNSGVRSSKRAPSDDRAGTMAGEPHQGTNRDRNLHGSIQVGGYRATAWA